jgi:hypothetical protein
MLIELLSVGSQSSPSSVGTADVELAVLELNVVELGVLEVDVRGFDVMEADVDDAPDVEADVEDAPDVVEEESLAVVEEEKSPEAVLD